MIMNSRKLFSLLLGLAVTAAASAQTWQDAYLFSENVYSGSARGVAMGNALTAVGGDPGSVNFNPAGSAVASYSQFFISPGFTISSTTAQGTILDGDVDPIGLGDQVKTGYFRMKLPNVGFILNMDTGRRSGWKNVSFGFLFNSTNNYTGRFNSSGVNSDNSYAASLASSADGFAPDVLGKEDWFYSGDYSRMPSWVDMTGFRSGMYDAVTGRKGAYVAITEVVDEDGNMRLAAPLYQKYGQQTRGSKSDLVFNLAANLSDILYLGANLGITSLNYRMAEYWYEEPNNPDQFPVISWYDSDTGTTESARFESLRMRREYRLNGTGVYLKAGALLRPFAGLRLGVAIQTPTLMNLMERYGYSGEVNLSGRNSPRANSPEDEWGYSMVNPFRFNAGIAYSVGQFAVLSADYERADYGQARFRPRSGGSLGDDYFEGTNLDIQDLLGASHMVRVGVEVKPVPFLALRGGWNYTTTGQRNILDGNQVVALSQEQLRSQAKSAWSAGLGYSSGNSFFADLAFRVRKVPADFFIPYVYYYAPNSQRFYDKVADDNIITPEVKVQPHLYDVILTMGWRF